MKKMVVCLWLAAFAALMLAPAGATADEDALAQWKAKRAALMKELMELRKAVTAAKMEARKNSEAVKAMDKDIRAARKLVNDLAAKDEKIAGLKKSVAELGKKRTELQKGIEAAKPIQARLDALKRPGKDATAEQKQAFRSEYSKIYREIRKVYAADKGWQELQKQITDANKAVREAMAANDDVKAAQAKADELVKKQNGLIAEDPAVKEAQAKVDAKMKEIKELKRPPPVRKVRQPKQPKQPKTDKPATEG